MHACMHRCYTVFSLTMYYNSMRLTDFSLVCEFQGLSLNKIQYYCKGIIISEIIIIEIIDSIYIYIYGWLYSEETKNRAHHSTTTPATLEANLPLAQPG